MLTVRFESDKMVLEKLYGELGMTGVEGGANFVLCDDGEPVGVMRTAVGDFVQITHFKVKNEEINGEDREFFLRAMLFKFSLNPVVLGVKGEHPELLKFGFRQEGDYMFLRSDEVRLKGHCGD